MPSVVQPIPEGYGVGPDARQCDRCSRAV